jgi:uncharacterized protein
MQHSRTTDEGGDRHRYTSRLRRRGVPVESRVEVRVRDRVEPGPLEHFLSARWGLHTRWLRRTWYVANAHEPWELYAAELVDLVAGGLLASVGLPELGSRSPDHVVHSPGVHAEFAMPSGAHRPRIVS